MKVVLLEDIAGKGKVQRLRQEFPFASRVSFNSHTQCHEASRIKAGEGKTRGEC